MKVDQKLRRDLFLVRKGPLGGRGCKISKSIGPSVACCVRKSSLIVGHSRRNSSAPWKLEVGQATNGRAEDCFTNKSTLRGAILDGRNRTIVIAESLARVIAAIRIASLRWWSYLRPKHRN